MLPCTDCVQTSRQRFGEKDKSSRVTGPVASVSQKPINTTPIVQPRTQGSISCNRFNVAVSECKRVTIAPNFHRIDVLLTIRGGPSKYVISTPHEKVQFHGEQLVERGETRAIHLESVNSALPTKVYLRIQAVGDFFCKPRTVLLPC